MKMSVRARWVFGGLIGLVTLAGASAFVVYRRFPLEYAEWQGTRGLKAAGATQFSATFADRPMRAWLRDGCAANDPGCRCLVLVHGLGDRATTWRKPLMAPLSTWERPVRLVAVDLPGNGDSADPASPEGYRLPRLAAAAAALVRATPGGCGEVWVVGNSMGGGVAAWLALDSSLRVRRLLLLSPGGIDANRYQDLANAPGPVGDDWTRVPSAVLLKNPSVESLKEFQRRAYFKARDLPVHVWRAAVERSRKSSTSDILRAQRPEDLPGTRLGEIRAPTLILWGLADHIIEVEEGRALAKRIPNALLREIPECGHLPQKECPEALYLAVNDLLRAGG